MLYISGLYWADVAIVNFVTLKYRSLTFRCSKSLECLTRNYCEGNWRMMVVSDGNVVIVEVVIVRNLGKLTTAGKVLRTFSL